MPNMSPRKCGPCQLCCKLVPVADMIPPKKDGQVCPHQITAHGGLGQFVRGCAIYPRRPRGCREWSCRWLTGADTHNIKRPDKAHYCIDIAPDFATITPEGGEERVLIIVQVWIDPAYPEVWRDPWLLQFIARQAAKGAAHAALIRLNAMDGFLLHPPTEENPKWWRAMGTPCERHSAADVAAAVGGARALGDLLIDAGAL